MNSEQLVKELKPSGANFIDYKRNPAKPLQFVLSSDRGRGRHESLYLPTWHKVVRNTEVVAEAFGRAPRYFD